MSYSRMSLSDNLLLVYILFFSHYFPRLLHQTMNLLGSQYLTFQRLRKEAAIIRIFFSQAFLFSIPHSAVVCDRFTCTPSTTSKYPQLHVPRG